MPYPLQPARLLPLLFLLPRTRGAITVCVCLAGIALLSCKQQDAPREVSPNAETKPAIPKLTSESQRQRLRTEVDARGPDYVPRTRHLENGVPRFTNRLISESSPYLLQHAHNPVDWFAWGAEALSLAKKLNRPIFLSVGYSTCHWCHVMEEESFEDEEIAAYLNTHYIPIKVDREERPDIDSLYMTAVQLLTRRGGWPMSVWLTPDLQPFFGGTYFPPRDGARGQRRGFLTLLKENAQAFKDSGSDVHLRANELVARLSQVLTPTAAGAPADRAVVERALKQAERSFDREHGGRRGAPKFPSSFPMRLLLNDATLSNNTKRLELVTRTATAMHRGGIYDHAGGGFHRYSVDARWLAPHFEKMLYDNAQLAGLYADLYRATAAPEYALVATETLDYLIREMLSENQLFYSATDADSIKPEENAESHSAGHREEGYFFTWTPKELRSSLSAAQYKLLRGTYPISEQGNFEGRNILHLKDSHVTRAKQAGIAIKLYTAQLSQLKQQLRTIRATRPLPGLDDKHQTSWNALVVDALARGARALGKPSYLSQAIKTADALLSRMRPQGRLVHSRLGEKVGAAAFLEDYAFLAGALLRVFEQTNQSRYLTEAITLMGELEQLFSDPVNGGYFLTAEDRSDLLVREKPDTDKALPSGNSAAYETQMRLYAITLNKKWLQRAETTLRAFSSRLTRTPGAMSELVASLRVAQTPARQLVIVHPNQTKMESHSATRAANPTKSASALAAVARSMFLPDVVHLEVQESQITPLLSNVPWLEGKNSRHRRPTAYLCEHGSCQLPTTSPRVLKQQLRQRSAKK